MVNDSKSEEEIYYAALEVPPAERSAYVKAACGDNLEMLERIESLLKIRENPDNFLDSPIFIDQPLLATPIQEQPGTVIGRYKLLEKIGEGGMAVVYMADQQEPISRKVALKIIKLGMDTKSVIARFEAERQALAMMEHSNIAKVLDAGSTETGRPYFVMELVTGVSITEYCDKNSLSTKERLGLFIQVCNAVQHAHQKGIIHRDIKPTNVMVTQRDGEPFPKVIDFGIAKAINQKLTEKTLFTRYAHIIGTPAYMSPEQAELSDLDVDTRSDIYSLGVLLYELLTGTTPFSEEELRKAGYVEMERIIREQEPVRPSTKLSTLGKTLTDIAKRRGCTPDLLTKTIRGDLDWIVMKSLEKDRTRRYGTVNNLSEDIRRHLEHEPVLAGPPSTGYRLRKFIRRNRAAVMTGLLVTAALLVVAVVSALYAREATLHANEAEDSRQEIAGLLAESYVDRAQALCEQGEVGRGMLWLADSLKIAPEDPNDLDRAVRTSLAAWHGQLHSLRTVIQYPDQITAVTFSSDGSRILVACRDGTVRFCDAATGQLIGRPLQHGSEIQDLVFNVAISPNSKRIATGGGDGSIRLWDADTMEPIGEPIQHERNRQRTRLIVFSPDSSRLITGGTDGAIRLWDANNGKSLGKAFHYEGEGIRSVQAIAYCPDGLRVVLDIDQGRYQMFDADRGESIGPPVDTGSYATAVAISPDGTRFATAKLHSLIQVWEAATGELAFEPVVHGGVIFVLAFSPDGSRIVSGGNTRIALLWNAATGEPIGAPLRQRNTLFAVAFSPDGTHIVTGNKDGVVRIWDLIKSKYIGKPVTNEDRILAAAYGPDGLRILTETDSAIQIRNAATGEPIGKPFSISDQINKIAFSPDGSRLLTLMNSSRNLLLWDLATGEGKLVGEPSLQITGGFTFNPDGSQILAAGRLDDIVRLWDVATLKCLGELGPRQLGVSRVAFSPDGSQILTGSYDGTTLLWDAATLKPIGKPLIHQSEVKGMTISPEGKKLLTGFADGTVRLWDTATLNPIGTPLQHVKIVCSVAFRPDGSQFLACSMDRMARLWDAATLKPIGPPLEHDCWWPRASFSPDGAEILLADGHPFMTAAVWRAPPGPLEGEYERIVCWVQVVTGLELDPTGGINVLDAPTWQKRHRQLQQLGGPPELTLPGF